MTYSPDAVKDGIRRNGGLTTEMKKIKNGEDLWKIVEPCPEEWRSSLATAGRHSYSHHHPRKRVIQYSRAVSDLGREAVILGASADVRLGVKSARFYPPPVTSGLPR